MDDASRLPDKEDRNWAMLAHVGALVVSLFSAGLLCFAVPLTIYLVKKDDPHEFVADHARESLNFRITLFLVYLVVTPLTFIAWITVIGICFMAPVLIVLWILELLFSVVAAAKAMGGERYRYPIAIRFIR